MSIRLGSGWKLGWEWYHPTHTSPARAMASLASTSPSGSISTLVAPSSDTSSRTGKAASMLISRLAASHTPPSSPMTSSCEERWQCRSLISAAALHSRTWKGCASASPLKRSRGTMAWSSAFTMPRCHRFLGTISRCGRCWAYCVLSGGGAAPAPAPPLPSSSVLSESSGEALGLFAGGSAAAGTATAMLRLGATIVSRYVFLYSSRSLPL
mmetsp:Transcript_12169/g.34317  ORF Transcript_12169/g.34317 Transcript_12169/m.34317 type:complete len:211 (-) Transcript_12169:428-1060(-)